MDGGCRSRRLQTACAVLICALFAACTGRGADESFAAAKAHIAKNESPAAIIELKNTLQARPDLAEARFLLGKLLLEREDPVAAAIELSKAAALQYPPDQLVPELATAYRLTGESNKVVALDASTTLTAPEAIARLKTQLAYAQAALGAGDGKVDEALAQALRARADHAPAQLLRARLLHSHRDPEAAMRLVDEVLARVPDDVDALTLKADMLVARRQSDAAQALYAKALALKPADIAAHSGLLAHSLAGNDLEAAATQLEAMKKARPTHPRTRYFDARLALQRGDLKAAASQAQQLLKIAPEHPEILYLVGTVAMQTGEMQMAEQHARKLFSLAPELADSRRLLAALLMRKGEPAKAIETIQPLLRADGPDADALHMAGQAYMALGDLKRSEEAFSLAGQLGHVGSRVALGLVKIARGDAAAGVGVLESVAVADKGATADLALIDVQLKLRNLPAALTAVERLKTKQPGKAQPLHMEGELRLRMGDAAAARASFDRALAAEPAYYPAVESLVALDLRENKADQARARVDAVLKRDPGEARALVALAALDERDGKPKQEVAATLAKAVVAKPADLALRRRLIEYHMGKQDYKLALGAAQEAVIALPNDVDAQLFLANAQLAAGETQQAISSYQKTVSARPKSPLPLMALAEAYLAAKSFDAAAEAVRKAQALAPEVPAVAQLAAKVDVRAGKHDQALTKARALQARTPKSADGWIIEGEVEVDRRHWPAAVAAFRKALQRQESSAVAQRLFSALRQAGDKAKTDAFAVDWLKRHPDDPAFLFTAAGQAIDDKDYAVADTRLEQTLRAAPDSPWALNNLAWVRAAQKKPGAVAMAQRANELAPNNPALMDTLAFALATEGDLVRAIEIQKKAVALAPSAHALRLSLARMYVDANDKTAARRELTLLKDAGSAFERQGEVQALEAKL